MDKQQEPTVLFGKSKWIWAKEPSKKDSNIILRRVFSFSDRPPSRAICRAACDTHYYLYVNGNAVVWQGGLARGKTAYYDEFDIAKYLVKGNNLIAVYCRRFGNEGRDLVSGERGGFIFECNDLNIYSDDTFTVYENPAYKKPAPSNCCYAGWNIRYDASYEGLIQNLMDPTFNSPLFVQASIIDGYPDTEMGVLQPRPVPLEKFSPQPVISKYKKSTDQFEGDTYTVSLPREMCVTPYFEVTGEGQEKILIRTDRSDVQGTFGDENSVYSAHTVEYITKPTVNIFEALQPMTGSELVFSMPHTVRVLKLGYRELGYNTARTCEIQTGNDDLDTLFDKAVNTLYCCMGSTLMDTPERERTMWLGDSSIAARALYLAFADSSALVKKVATDIFDYADGDVLYSCVPGNVPVDIPAHGLLALSEYGLFAQYRNFTTETDLFRSQFTRLCDYLMLWEMTEHGVAIRDGNRRWYDNLYNIDEPIVENALYYSACKFMISLGNTIGDHSYDETFADRMDNIAEYIESCWDGLGYTSKPDCYDDRANALVTLCGLVQDDRKKAVARLIAATQNASPYLEWAAIEALSMLGRRDLALNRFVSRYGYAAKSDDTTLGEDFNGYGTKCQSYQSAVIFELIQIFGGISVKDGAGKIDITPDFTALKDYKCSLKLASGNLEVKYKYSPSRVDIVIENGTTAKVTLDISPERIDRSIDRRTIVINKGKNKFTI